MTNSLWRDAVIGGLIAAVLNIIVYFISQALGVSFVVRPDSATEFMVSPLPVAILTFVPALLAGLLLWILGRFTRGDRIFMWIALIVALLSFIPTYLAATDMPTMVMLSIMHVVAALTIVWWLVIRNPIVFDRPKPGSEPI